MEQSTQENIFECLNQPTTEEQLKCLASELIVIEQAEDISGINLQENRELINKLKREINEGFHKPELREKPTYEVI